MKVSVIIPTVNRRDRVVQTVGSVLRQNFPASDYEIIVVVDGGADDTAEALRSHESASRLRIVEQENRGPSAARNAGFRIATGELLVFLDDDMICSEGWLRAHVEAHEGSEDCEFVGMGAIDMPPDDPPRLAGEMFSRGLGAELLLHRDFPDRAWPENAWTFANTSIRRRTLERVGGFDERFRKREDCELGIRLLKDGVRQRFVADAATQQRCDKSVKQVVRDAEAFAECDLLFLEKHPGRMPHDFFSRIRREGFWKRKARHFLSRHLRFSDAILGPLCAAGDRRQAPGLLRRWALKALMFRCGLHWYHRLAEVSGRAPEELT